MRAYSIGMHYETQSGVSRLCHLVRRSRLGRPSYVQDVVLQGQGKVEKESKLPYDVSLTASSMSRTEHVAIS